MPGPRWYPAVVAVFSSALIVSNIIAVKLVDLFGLTLPAGVVLFPIVYIVGDVLTEVYGFARARQAIWIGFGCNLLAVGSIWIAGKGEPAGATFKEEATDFSAARRPIPYPKLVRTIAPQTPAMSQPDLPCPIMSGSPST